MKTKMAILVAALSAFFFCLPSYGEEEGQQDFRPMIIEGSRFIERGVDLWDLQTLMNGRGIFEKIVNVQEEDYLSHYYLAYADYRICIMHVSQNEKKMALDYLDDGIEHLERSVDLNPTFAESRSLLASLYGWKIGFHWRQAMTLGPRSGRHFEKAVELDSLNPRTYLLLGISRYNTPRMFGGGTDKAEANLLKAITLYERASPVDSLLPAWGYEEAYAWLGNVYMGKKEYEKARVQFDKAMEIEPGYGWVKYVLLEELKQKTKKERGD